MLPQYHEIATVEKIEHHVRKMVPQIPSGLIVVDIYTPHSCPCDCYGAAHCRDYVAALKQLGNVDATWCHEHHTSLCPVGTGRGGAVRFGDAMLPGRYFVLVAESDKQKAIEALAERERLITAWLNREIEWPRHIFSS
jgi:hypothetical protein